ncbi:iron-containing alcohol dehydrogenase, partial [Gilvimarinus sp. 1_MG-2023]
ARNFGAQRVLIVTDPGVIASGWVADVQNSLQEMDIDYRVFSAVSPNPRTEEVMAGAAFYNEEGCNLIVAVGGGSPMDCAKGIG